MWMQRTIKTICDEGGPMILSLFIRMDMEWEEVVINIPVIYIDIKVKYQCREMYLIRLSQAARILIRKQSFSAHNGTVGNITRGQKGASEIDSDLFRENAPFTDFSSPISSTLLHILNKADNGYFHPGCLTWNCHPLFIHFAWTTQTEILPAC